MSLRVEVRGGWRARGKRSGKRVRRRVAGERRVTAPQVGFAGYQLVCLACGCLGLACEL
jgi:hypothetical protein